MQGPARLGTDVTISRPDFISDVSARDERILSLKALVSRLVHDFNNYLVPLLGYVTLIKEELPSDSPAFQYASRMESSARKTESSLDDLRLACSPGDRFAPSQVDLRGLVEREVAAWHADLSTVTHIRIRMALEECHLFLDEALWTAVLRQLLSNARFALATGGTLHITLQPRVLSARRMAELGLGSPEVFELVIQDDGFGMSEEVLRCAWDPFFSTRSKGQSSGLGLTIVHSIVRLHGGQVVLESAEDAGTQVTIWIPSEVCVRPPGTTPESSGSRMGVSQGGASRRRVLVVDDDPMVREVIGTHLQRLGLQVMTAEDGSDALKVMDRNGGRVDLVVSDLTMPNMGGVDLCLELRRRDPALKVILISGDAESSCQEALSKLGSACPRLVKKPFNLKLFAEEIRSALD